MWLPGARDADGRFCNLLFVTDFALSFLRLLQLFTAYAHVPSSAEGLSLLGRGNSANGFCGTEI